ncbi:hypothetical protein BZL29_6514 [Mycobacterium kansasii]|uniref:Uncharacterized protein n=1 Tax=Mycobacterium kansasii TaxID=1768 RepID=A0A1V3WRJ4_MYCKA|nr:hypothetical protein BZL29_6514 [Mycobacterium kansasii]
MLAEIRSEVTDATASRSLPASSPCWGKQRTTRPRPMPPWRHCSYLKQVEARR